MVERLTHLIVAILALSPRANERIEPRLDAIADDGMQTFVRCFLSAEEIEYM
jgi:hypothetical protein